jgi:hypothetical protein
MQHLSKRDQAIVGNGPGLIEGWIAVHGRRWRDVVDRLGKSALTGELDPTILDRPDSFMLRWLVGNAYEHLGEPDSSIVYFKLILQPTRIPPGHMALRGLSYSFAHRRLADIATARGDTAQAAQHLSAFIAAFTDPDATTRPMVDAAVSISSSRR